MPPKKKTEDAAEDAAVSDERPHNTRGKRGHPGHPLEPAADMGGGMATRRRKRVEGGEGEIGAGPGGADTAGPTAPAPVGPAEEAPAVAPGDAAAPVAAPGDAAAPVAAPVPTMEAAVPAAANAPPAVATQGVLPGPPLGAGGVPEGVHSLLGQAGMEHLMGVNSVAAAQAVAAAAASQELHIPHSQGGAVAEMLAAAQQDALHVHALHTAHENFYTQDVMQRSQLEGQRKADFQALAAAKRSGNLAIITFTLDLPPELADVELPEKTGILEVPVTGDVPMLKRLFMYQAHNKLLPALQVLVTEQDEVMVDHKDDGTPMPLAHYGIQNDSRIILRVVVPDTLDDVPLVDEALASAAYTNTGSSSRTPSRKTRWTNEQIEALVEGVEKYGLSAWRTIVMDPRLAGKNNMQCKDKFRNLCLTIIQGRPERGLTLHWQLKDRVRALIDQENIKGVAAQQAEQAGLAQGALTAGLPQGSGAGGQEGVLAGVQGLGGPGAGGLAG